MCRDRLRSLIFQYYPVYAYNPIIYESVLSSNSKIGIFEGDLILSHSVHIESTKKVLQKKLKGVGDSCIEVILNFVFKKFQIMQQ